MISLARKLATIGAVAFIATGCGSTPPEAEAINMPVLATSSATPEPKVERTADPNDQACIIFAESHNDLADRLNDGKGELTVEQWRQSHLNAVKLLDMESLLAEGEIGERMQSAVALIPATPIEMTTTSGWRIGEEYNQAIEKVHTACTVGGVAYGMKDLTLPLEFLRQ